MKIISLLLFFFLCACTEEVIHNHFSSPIGDEANNGFIPDDNSEDSENLDTNENSNFHNGLLMRAISYTDYYFQNFCYVTDDTPLENPTQLISADVNTDLNCKVFSEAHKTLYQHTRRILRDIKAEVFKLKIQDFTNTDEQSLDFCVKTQKPDEINEVVDLINNYHHYDEYFEPIYFNTQCIKRFDNSSAHRFQLIIKLLIQAIGQRIPSYGSYDNSDLGFLFEISIYLTPKIIENYEQKNQYTEPRPEYTEKSDELI